MTSESQHGTPAVSSSPRPHARFGARNSFIRFMSFGTRSTSVGHQTSVVRRSGLFAARWYADLYLKSHRYYKKPLHHYLTIGAYEGLRPNPIFDSFFYLARYPDVRTSGTNPLYHYVQWGAIERRNPSTLFETEYYLTQNPAIDRSGAQTELTHYLLSGIGNRSNPHLLFGTHWYLVNNPDVAASGINPLWHFMAYGAAEGRNPHPLFNTSWYVQQYRHELADDKNPLEHFLQSGAESGCKPHPLFETAWYLATYPDVAANGMNPLCHFVAHGAAEGRSPHPLFNTRWYVQQYGRDVEPGANPLEHFMRRGAASGCNPSPSFDTAWYLREYPEVAAANLNPLVHYVLRGSAEGRRTSPPPISSRRSPAPHEKRSRGSAPGANFIGPVACVNGLGTSARGYLKAMKCANITVNVVPWTIGFERVDKIDTLTFDQCEPLPINLVHLNLDLITQSHLIDMSVLPQLVTADRYNIAIVYWELAAIAPEWFETITQFDEIWCASSFMARTFEAISAKPVRVVRPAIAFSSDPPQRARHHFGLPEDKYIFAYMFDVGSVVGRKNPLAFVKAYIEEFHAQEGAVCFVKIGYAPAGLPAIEAIRSLAERRPDIILVERIFASDEIADLFNHIDCYVSPHRSEGLGLTIIEAMAAAKPVIAVRYGGVTDFVTPDTSFIVDHKLIEVGEGNAPYRPRYIWADPIQSSLRQCMRAAFEDRRAAQVKGMQGRAIIDRLFSPTRTGEALAAELGRVSANIRE
ncbi:glycosyltransferase family 4 protein [Reyranella sp. CPCC 100927]|uniref:glycosyltransferase family 4 protein n=1 Tax=Reyranella sp. CPCC 100927 TaxID=2599616 RepID=UPI0011B6D6B6|nr:glycosyltransferase family 4 protein [Reyranella sp. CPCC 100927]TWT05689.1 glycosyltransferase family 4 protein [Reyranella sp. CPCC 100927]